MAVAAVAGWSARPREPAPERLLASGSPTLAYGVYQLISAHLIDRHILRAKVDAQRVCQTQRHPAGLAVDHQRGHTGSAQLISYQP